MKDSEIIKFIRTLEPQVPKEKAEAQLVSFGEVALYANKEGYIRMALELLKCAFKETHQEADLTYLFGKKSDFSIDHLATTKDELDFYSK